MKRKQKDFKLTKAHNWLIFEIMNEALQQAFDKYAEGCLLDIGCGEKPYKRMLSGKVSKHVGLDHEGTFHETAEVDIFGTAYKIPVANESFDTVLCTYVLEHLEEPALALQETSRVLKPGGNAIYTVPLFWHLHEEPRDFYRYTKHGLKYLFEKSGFEVVEIIPISGFIVTFAQELAYFLRKFANRKGGRFSWLNWLVRWVVPRLIYRLQWVALKLNKYDKSYEFSIEYLVVGRKKQKE